MSKKTYTQEVATTIATKLTESKGVAHFAHNAGNGKFKVLTQAEIDALTQPTQAEAGPESQDDSAVITAAEQVETATAVAAGKSKEWANEVVSVTVPGKITKMYVITPELGGKPRWFEIARLKSKPAMVDGQVQFNCTRGTLLSRKLKELADNATLAA